MKKLLIALALICAGLAVTSSWSAPGTGGGPTVGPAGGGGGRFGFWAYSSTGFSAYDGGNWCLNNVGTTAPALQPWTCTTTGNLQLMPYPFIDGVKVDECLVVIAHDENSFVATERVELQLATLGPIAAGAVTKTRIGTPFNIMNPVDGCGAIAGQCEIVRGMYVWTPGASSDLATGVLTVEMADNTLDTGAGTPLKIAISCEF